MKQLLMVRRPTEEGSKRHYSDVLEYTDIADGVH